MTDTPLTTQERFKLLDQMLEELADDRFVTTTNAFNHATIDQQVIASHLNPLSNNNAVTNNQKSQQN